MFGKEDERLVLGSDREPIEPRDNHPQPTRFYLDCVFQKINSENFDNEYIRIFNDVADLFIYAKNKAKEIELNKQQLIGIIEAIAKTVDGIEHFSIISGTINREDIYITLGTGTGRYIVSFSGSVEEGYKFTYQKVEAENKS